MKQKTMKKPARRWTADDAAEVLEELDRSGLSLGAFARQRGLCAQRLRWWRGQLALRAQEEPVPSAVPGVRLVELVPPAAALAAPRLQVHCPSGHTIELVDLDPAQGLPLVLAALRALSC